MTRSSRALLACLALWAASGCASTAPGGGFQPGTGDLSFRLLWQGDADLDLHVREPGGRHVGFVPPWLSGEEGSTYAERLEQQSETGVIDVDCNAAEDRNCPFPMENVFWPTGTAEAGSYEVWVELFRPPTDGSEVDYVVEVRRGMKVVRRLEGRLAAARETSATERIEFRGRGRATAR